MKTQTPHTPTPPSLQMGLHQLQLVMKSQGYKESNGDDWLGTPLDTAMRAMANIICSWDELERKANAYEPMVELLKEISGVDYHNRMLSVDHRERIKQAIMADELSNDPEVFEEEYNG